ncbi:MAG: mannonate dehydratase [Bacteroidota bacterium]|jgi:mannonate dehydratase
MKELRQTWRWFGPNDPVTLQDVKQTGAVGIVTALHHVPHGEVWTYEEIMERKNLIESYGLTWDVVESVTIHEEIKTRTGDYLQWIEKYKESLKNLAKAGLRVITYNFMPVNDWTRTNLDYLMPDGSKALYFNWVDLAVFDIFMLQRENAEKDYSKEILEEAKKRHSTYTKEQLEQLAGVVMFGIPGEKKETVEGMRIKLARYKNIDATILRSNLVFFLQQITPLCDELGLQLAIHPDDPPTDILGLPRIVKNMEDLQYILDAVPNKSNGICFCTGSLGANPKNNLPEMAKKIGKRIHFTHLRNVKKDAQGNFFEDDHLAGDNDMYAVLKELLKIQQEVPYQISFRPDHGHQMIDDLNKVTNPGYSCIGRLRGLAEIRGLQLGILRAMEE